MAAVPKPPAHLSRASKGAWRKIAEEYSLAEEPAALAVLRLALEAVDRCEQARLAMAEDGPVIEDRFGQPKPSPWVAIERDSRIAAARLFRELSLDPGDPNELRIPRVGGGRS